MDFTFSSEQDDLRRTLRDVAADRCSPGRLREVLEQHDGFDADLWQLLTGELGVAGVAVGDQYGGTGGSFIDAAVVLEEGGSALLPVPLLTSLVAAEVIQRGDWSVATRSLPQLASGERRAAIAVASGVVSSGDALTGSVAQVIDGHRADVLVIAAPDGVWLVEASDASVGVTGRPSLDPTRWHALVELASTEAARIGDATASAEAVDLLRVALAVESVGIARHCLAATVGFLKTRVQFSRPIGSFQALQHRAADLLVELESAASTAYFAAWAAAEAAEELPVVAPLAKAVCADAAYRITAETIQLHGGMGFTWEHEAHLYFKRATANRLMLGDSQVQRRLVADRSHLLRAPTSG
jgi:alkylation response protein AidB-like acyl-CoA dehydrogenase